MKEKVKLAIPEGKPPFLSLPKAEDYNTNIAPNEYAQIIQAIGQCVKSNKTTQFEKENVFHKMAKKTLYIYRPQIPIETT